MRFVRFGPTGEERAGLLLEDGTHRAVDLSVLGHDVDGSFLAALPYDDLMALTYQATNIVDLDSVRLGPPIARPSAIYAIGLNYHDHAKETGMASPSEPIVFSKSPNSLCGSTDDVTLPRGATRGDWEVEIGVVMGRAVFELASPDDAVSAIAGYVAANDVSERRLQLEGGGGQWMRGKSFPTACPLGPWLATPDILDLGAAQLTLSVNGEVRQNGVGSDMIFSVPEIVWHMSQYLRLEPGDLVLTGTPAGVGLGRNPEVFLDDGDVIDIAVTGLGALRNTIRIPPLPQQTTGVTQ